MSTFDQPSVRERWHNQQDSIIFRRGRNMSSSDEEFVDIIEGVRAAAKGKEHVSVLVVGVARGQEPLSLLVVLEHIAQSQDKGVEDFLDFDLVDVRSPINGSSIVASEFKYIIDEMFSGNEVVFGGLEIDDDTRKYRIKQTLRQYFGEKITGPSAHWNTAIQEYLQGEKDKKYDCITYNNVDGHILSADDRSFVMRELLSRLNIGGVVITDPDYGGSLTLAQLPEYNDLQRQYQLQEILPGIFQRQA